MNEDQQVKRRKLLFIGLGIVYIIVMTVIFFFVFTGSDEDESRYELDEVTGREFFVDPNQATETGDNLEIISVLNTNDLVNYLYGDYLFDFRTQLSAFIKENISEEVKIVYVDGEVTRNPDQQILFEVISKEPVEKRISVVVFINSSDTVQTTFKIVN